MIPKVVGDTSPKPNTPANTTPPPANIDCSSMFGVPDQSSQESEDQNKQDCIYMLTSFMEFKEHTSPDGKAMSVYASRRNILGYYLTQEEADRSIITNSTTIYAHTYNYAVVEQIPEGLFTEAVTHWLYKYNEVTRVYELIEDPDNLPPWYQFAMG